MNQTRPPRHSLERNPRSARCSTNNPPAQFSRLRRPLMQKSLVSVLTRLLGCVSEGGLGLIPHGVLPSPANWTLCSRNPRRKYTARAHADASADDHQLPPRNQSESARPVTSPPSGTCPRNITVMALARWHMHQRTPEANPASTASDTYGSGAALAGESDGSVAPGEYVTELVVDLGARLVRADDLDGLAALGVLGLDRVESGDRRGVPDVGERRSVR